MYAAVFGVGVVMALPLVFVVVVGACLVVSHVRLDHRPAVYAQLICITWISALIQWSIGSAVDSGLVICWSFLGPIGGLVFLPWWRAVALMGVFLAIVAISFIFEPALLGDPLPVSDEVRMMFFGMNVGTSLTIVFAAAAWFTWSLQRALADLTEAQVQLVDAEKQAVVGRLVAGMLHEMNTPLGVIRSSTQSMSKVLERTSEFVSEHADEEKRGDKKLLRMLSGAPALSDDVQASVERLGTFADGLSSFVSLDESGDRDVDVRESLDTAVALLGDNLEGRIVVDRVYEDTLPVVSCTPALLNRALLCVLKNAVEAIDDEGTVRIEARAVEDRVVVTVVDDGRGIPHERLSGIFDIGFSTQAGRVGMRLGLPMCKRHLEEMGGRITIESDDGAGTRVQITLPAVSTG